METKAQILGITSFPYQEFDDKGKLTYRENSYGHWWKSEYDEHGNETYREWDDGTWYGDKYDKNGMLTYYEDDDGEKTYYIR